MTASVLRGMEAAETRVQIRWRVVGVLGALSLVTAPVTAIWALLLAPLSLVAAALRAAVSRSPRRAAAAQAAGASVALGLLVGPAIYLSLALLT